MARRKEDYEPIAQPPAVEYSDRTPPPSSYISTRKFFSSPIRPQTKNSPAIPDALEHVFTGMTGSFLGTAYGFRYAKSDCNAPYVFASHSAAIQENENFTRYTAYGPYNEKSFQSIVNNRSTLEAMSVTSAAHKVPPKRGYINCDMVMDTKLSGESGERFQLAALGALILFAADGMDVLQSRPPSGLRTDTYLKDGFTVEGYEPVQGRAYLEDISRQAARYAVAIFDPTEEEVVSFVGGLNAAETDAGVVAQKINFDDFPDFLQSPVIASVPSLIDPDTAEPVAALVARASFLYDDWRQRGNQR